MYNFLFFQKRTSSFPASKLASVLLYKNDTYFQHGSSALEIIIKTKSSRSSSYVLNTTKPAKDLFVPLSNREMTSFLPLPRSREGFLLPPFPSFNVDPEKRLKEIQDLDTRETDILVNAYPKSGKRAL